MESQFIGEVHPSKQELPRPRRSHTVSIGELRRLGKKLEVGCTRCWHVIAVSPAALALHGNIAVTDAHKRLHCAKCGARAAYSRVHDGGEHGVQAPASRRLR